MNIEKHLILIKGEDKTEAVHSCIYESGKWQVDYEKGKTYAYQYLNVKWYRDPVLLNPAITLVYQNNQPLSGVNKILIFKDYIRIVFISGTRRIYRKEELTMEQSCLSNQVAQNTFEYLKVLANKVSIANEGESSFLSKQYEKIICISPNAVLAKYINPMPLNSTQYVDMPIFPFGFNLSQKAATEKALTEQISVIEGPPGTGKTQTILNIIANAIISGKTVAVVSNNNAATANVLEKLQKYGVDFIAAYLGNTENKEKFIAEQTQTYPNMSAWMMNTIDYNTVRKILEASGNELKEMLEVKNRVAVLKQELSALLVEKEYLNTYYDETNEEIVPYRSWYYHNADTIVALWFDYQQMAEKDKVITLMDKLKKLLHYGIFTFSFYKNSSDKVISFFQRLYYEQKEKELNEKIGGLTKRLESYQFDKAMRKYSEESMRLFKAKLAERYSLSKERKLFTKASFGKDFGSFIQEYPVLLSTTHSLRSCISANYLFDYVIMDGAVTA